MKEVSRNTVYGVWQTQCALKSPGYQAMQELIHIDERGERVNSPITRNECLVIWYIVKECYEMFKFI